MIKTITLCAISTCLTLVFGGTFVVSEAQAQAQAQAQDKTQPRMQEQFCLSASEMREAISENHVIQPVTALKSARAAAPGDVVRIRLCREEETLIYLVTTLKRDGRVQRVTVEAVSGKVTVVR